MTYLFESDHMEANTNARTIGFWHPFLGKVIFGEIFQLWGLIFRLSRIRRLGRADSADLRPRPATPLRSDARQTWEAIRDVLRPFPARRARLGCTGIDWEHFCEKSFSAKISIFGTHFRLSGKFQLIFAYLGSGDLAGPTRRI